MRRDDPDRSSALRQAALLGAAHLLVDAGCGYLLFRDLAPGTAVALILAYDAVAFGGQAPLGLAVDRLRVARGAAGTGVLVVAAALLAALRWPAAAAIAAGAGNALYHVGAGAQVLRRSGARAADGGVFVGPGAVGIFAGVSLGLQGVDARAALVALLALALPAVVHLVAWDAPPAPTAAAPDAPRRGTGLAAAIALGVTALLASVMVRALAGGAAGATWRGHGAVLAALAVAAMTGKVMGGLLSDRLGWAASTAVALIVAAPLLGPLAGAPAAAVLGVLLLQATMPVTLKATHLAMPSRPALAFGLPCLALFLGTVLGKAQPMPWLHRPAGITAALLASAALVLAGLRLVGRARAAAPSAAGQRREQEAHAA